MSTLQLQVLWLNTSIGLAINQQTAQGKIPLTSYYFWPINQAWEQLRFELEVKSWITVEERESILNTCVEIMNHWQESKKLFGSDVNISREYPKQIINSIPNVDERLDLIGTW